MLPKSEIAINTSPSTRRNPISHKVTNSDHSSADRDARCRRTNQSKSKKRLSYNPPSYMNDFSDDDGDDADKVNALKSPNVQFAGTRQGRPLIRYKSGDLPSKEEAARRNAQIATQMVKLEMEMDEIVDEHQRKKKQLQDIADVETGEWKKKEARKALRRFRHETFESGREEADVVGTDDEPELTSVIADQVRDEWESEDDVNFDVTCSPIENHDFWQATHPPIPGTKRAKFPPRDKQIVSIPRWIGVVTKSWPERIILALLVYYFQISKVDGKLRARVRRDGAFWVAKTDVEMAAETMLHKTVVKKYRARLIKAGLIKVAHHRFPQRRRVGTVMLRMCYYRIDWDRLEAAYLENGGSYVYLEDKVVQAGISRAVANDDDDDDDE